MKKKTRPKCKRISEGVSLRFKSFLALAEDDREMIGGFMLSVAKNAIIKSGEKRNTVLECVRMLRFIEQGLAEIVYWDDGTASARIIPGAQIHRMQ